LLRTMLELLGWEAVEADSGATARALAARESFDLVLLDYQMPDADGAETALALRKLLSARAPTRKLAIYLLTANLFIHEQLEALAAVDGILAKPLSRAALLKLLSGLATQEEAAPRAGPTLDPVVIEDLGALKGRDGRNMLARVAERVRADQERDLAGLQATLAAQEWAAAARLAHALAGHAALVGARRATQLARELETCLARSPLKPSEAEAMLFDLRAAWAEAEAALSRLVDPYTPG
jgi:CheY-like chemotaxis protein